MSMAKKYILIPAVLFSVFAYSSPVFAQSRSTAGEDVLKFVGATAQKGGLTTNPNADTDITQIVIVVINMILALTGIIFFVHMFYGGFRWMTAKGNEQDITEAKETIRNAMIGILVTLSAFFISNFVFNQLAKINARPPAKTSQAPVAPPG